MDNKENPNYFFNSLRYKSKYICTDCRKSFKRRILEDFIKDENLDEKEPKCPNCGMLTVWIGPKFRAPKSDNIKAWTSIRVLKDLGVMHFVGWANIPIDIPESTKELHCYLTTLKDIYKWNVQKWSTRDYSPINKDQIKYFTEAINRIDTHLQTL